MPVQVCLAAEECGHLNFDSRVDMWWNSDSFHCGSGPRGSVHFHDIFLKVTHCPNQVRGFCFCRSSQSIHIILLLSHSVIRCSLLHRNVSRAHILLTLSICTDLHHHLSYKVDKLLTACQKTCMQGGHSEQGDFVGVMWLDRCASLDILLP